MTKKDYELIAQAVRVATIDYEWVAMNAEKANRARRIYAEALAHKFEKDNAKFDKLKFLTACGMGSTLKFSNGKELHDPYNILAND